MELKNENQISDIDRLNLDNLNIIKTKKSLILNKYLIFFSYLLLVVLLLSIILLLFYEKKNIQRKNWLEKNQTYIEQKLINFEKNQNLFFKLNKLYKIYSNHLRTSNKLDLVNLFHPLDVLGINKIRIGKKSDGGYILLDDFKDVKIAYSLGISREISFDKVLADKGIDVYMYDHTIKKLPFENPRFHWKKVGISGKNEKNKNMKKLSDLIKENGHINEHNMILKLDIESYEWDLFKELSINIISQFKYIVGEFHFNEKKKFNYYEILTKIQKTHQIFHLHCNNCAGKIINLYGYKICSLLEISLILKKDYHFNKINETFPIEGIDYKNCKNKYDNNYLLNIFI